MAFDVNTFDIKTYDNLINRGLSTGLGNRGSQMCIEAVICCALGLPHSDDPGCVAISVRSFKITLNDKKWSNPEARAKGLRNLGLAQLGSLGVVNDAEFVSRLSKKLIQILIPKLFRAAFKNQRCLDAATRCEQEGTRVAVMEVYRAASAAAANAAYGAADAAASAAAVAADASYAKDEYLILAANLALEVLKELKSPGCQLL
jgi:hypothetical protein